MTIERLFFYPPLAFARLGGSDTPLQCFHWGENDDTPRGTGKTTVVPGRTLMVAADGEVSEAPEADGIVFKDGDAFRPVCPFFELHAAWTGDDGALQEGPVTAALLAQHGNHRCGDLIWQVDVANLKPFQLTQDPATRIAAQVTLAGDDTRPWPLRGVSPADVPDPLVPSGCCIPFGSVQLTQPNAAFPELRLRFTPAKGCFYGPTDLTSRRWSGLQLSDAYLFLNENSSWCRWTSVEGDRRCTPGGQFAADDSGVSFGMVDDICDGLICCRLGDLVAYARIAVAPPDYAPDRRHVVSLADGLKDRVDRAEVFAPAYWQDQALCDHEISELMQRAYETSALTNVDVTNHRVNLYDNPFIAILQGIPFRHGELDAFPHRDDGWNLPLTEQARASHRRLQVITMLKALIRRDPALLPRYVRAPLDRNPFFDRRMPVLMRGSSGDPLTLTRRQYDFLLHWAARL